MLPGLGSMMALAGSRPVTGAHAATASGGTTIASTYTFSSIAIGAPGDGRFVVVAVALCYSSTAAPSVTGVTIAGVPATLLAAKASDAGKVVVAMAGAYVPAGATADVVVSLSSDASYCRVTTYALYDVQSPIPRATAVDGSLSTRTLSTTIDVPAQGAVICCAIGRIGSATATSTTWTGGVEHFDNYYVSGTNSNYVVLSGAALFPADDQSGLSVSATFSTSVSGGSLVAVSIR